METALVVILVIVLTFWFNRNAWFRGTTTSYTTKTPSPSWRPSVSLPRRFHWGWLALIGLVVWGGWSYTHRSAKQDEKASAPAQQVRATVLTKALILRFDGFTPCDPRIDFPFELDTQGDPISLKFPGVPKPVKYSGKGTLDAPTNRVSGPVHTTSDLPDRQARVRIWEVKYVEM